MSCDFSSPYGSRKVFQRGKENIFFAGVSAPGCRDIQKPWCLCAAVAVPGLGKIDLSDATFALDKLCAMTRFRVDEQLLFERCAQAVGATVQLVSFGSSCASKGFEPLR